MTKLQSVMTSQQLTKDDLLTMLRQMAEIRAFEENWVRTSSRVLRISTPVRKRWP